MGKFYVDVIFTICTFSFFFALTLSYLNKNISIVNKIISLSILTIGIFLGFYIHLLRIKNKKEMIHIVTKLNRYVLALCLLILILTTVSLLVSKTLKTDTKLNKIVNSIVLTLMFIEIACMLYLIIPRLLTQSMEFIAFGEDSVSTLTLFRVSGYILGILTGLLLILAIYKFLIRCSKRQYTLMFGDILKSFFKYSFSLTVAVIPFNPYSKKVFKNIAPNIRVYCLLLHLIKNL